MVILASSWGEIPENPSSAAPKRLLRWFGHNEDVDILVPLGKIRSFARLGALELPRLFAV
jgi:hypothetical protein